MKINLYSVGDKMPAWIANGFNEYNKRLPKHLKINLVELADNAHKRTDITTWQKALSKISNHAYIIALTPEGKQLSTNELAAQLQNWQTEHSELVFLIGGADGLPDLCLKRANLAWSLSNLTFPHMIVRIILAEQIYRAWSIHENHPYHRE